MEKKTVNICIYSRQFVQNVESILNRTDIVMNKIKEGFDEHYEKFKPFLQCVKEGNLEYYMKRIKAREEGVEIANVSLNEIEKFLSNAENDKIAKEMLNDMENTLNLVKDVNYERMKEFLYRSNLVFIFTEFENYLFKCIKFILLKYPEVLDEKSISLKEIRLIHNNGNYGYYGYFPFLLIFGILFGLSSSSKEYKNYINKEEEKNG